MGRTISLDIETRLRGNMPVELEYSFIALFFLNFISCMFTLGMEVLDFVKESTGRKNTRRPKLLSWH